jgi:hypothetical protein
MMNQHDRDNLNFLLTASAKTLKDWQNQADEDDFIYAQELLAAYSKELKDKSAELLVEATLETHTEYREAKNALKKFTLQHN